MRPACGPWGRPLLGGLVTAGAGSAVFLTGRSALPLPAAWTLPDLHRWWVATGWVVGIFALGRLVVLIAAVTMSLAFLVVAMTVAVRSPGRRSVCLAAVARLPGGRLMVRLALGVTASGVMLGACSAGTPALARMPDPGRGSPPPAVGAGSAVVARASTPTGRTTGAGEEPAPVLRNMATNSALPDRVPSAARPPHRRHAPPPAAATPAPVPGNRPHAAATPAPVPGNPPPTAPAAAASVPGNPPPAGSSPPAAATPTRAMEPAPAPAPPPPAPASADPGTAVRPSSAPGAHPGSAPAGGDGASRQWQVRPGDSLWSIAEATAGSPDRVPGYWLRLIALNRPRLPVPDDPSLLFPGDTVILPPLQPEGL